LTTLPILDTGSSSDIQKAGTQHLGSTGKKIFKNIMLNTDSPLPLYHQLSDILMERIRTGTYPEGSKIPSEHCLAETFGIGRPTARQATDLLVRKNILIRKRGSGTFVAEKPKEVDLFSLAGTLSSFREKGIALQTAIIEEIHLADVTADDENPFFNKQAYFLSRLGKVSGKPVLIEDIYLHATIFSGINRIDLRGKSLSRVVLENFYMRPVGGNQNFRIGYLSGKRAEYLNVSSKTPILVVKRFLHFSQAENAIFSELYCLTDRFVFSQKIGGAQNG
jgi:GntR family transcriptional regulator